MSVEDFRYGTIIAGPTPGNLYMFIKREPDADENGEPKKAATILCLTTEGSIPEGEDEPWEAGEISLAWVSDDDVVVER